MQKKNFFSKKESHGHKQELTFPACRETWKKREIDRIVCRICTERVHDACIFDIYNNSFFAGALLWNQYTAEL